MPLDLAALEKIWRAQKDRILCPKAPICPTQWKVKELPFQKICYTEEYPKCWFFPQIPFPAEIVAEHRGEYSHKGIWGYEIHPERSNSGKSCRRCIDKNGNVYNGNAIAIAFRYHEHIDKYRIKANLHPNCNCELWQLMVITRSPQIA